MSDAINIPVAQMREAAAAWRKHDKGNTSLHDRIGEFIDEIERLREGITLIAADRDKLEVEVERLRKEKLDEHNG